MKILVTGGAGFIGSHLVDALVARGDEVIVVDHYQREKLRYPNPAATTYKCDFRDPAVGDILANERPDAVCHLAAQISVTHSIAHPIADARRNIIDALHFLDLAHRAGVRKFVFSSSGGAIYGDHPVRPTPLLHDTFPNTPYGVSKQMFEHYLAQYWEQYGLPYVSLRFANVYGPRQQAARQGDEGNVISVFLHRMLDGRPVIIYGDGTASRDYVFVHDAVDAFVRALSTGYVGPVNISTGKETSVRALYDVLVGIHGDPHPLSHEPYRHGETVRSVLSYDSAKTHLDWEPMTSLEDGLKATYDWFMETFRGRGT
ncbi:NAD-dependent epimerase/dehydratase family protein [Candidatus Uhrbacteria bacterium]|nr:NAD-dependent epimerase/dehydratase family protein [Candidatus Uhrbacteria bacterium]